MSNSVKKNTTVKVKDMVKPGKQVQTVVDYTGQNVAIKLECPECGFGVDRLGARFCSNCGAPLKWDNISVRQPKPAPEAGENKPSPEVKEDTPEPQMN